MCATRKVIAEIFSIVIVPPRKFLRTVSQGSDANSLDTRVAKRTPKLEAPCNVVTFVTRLDASTFNLARRSSYDQTWHQEASCIGAWPSSLLCSFFFGRQLPAQPNPQARTRKLRRHPIYSAVNRSPSPPAR